MKVRVKTSITPTLTVYDSNAQPSQSAAFFKQFFAPVIFIEDDSGNTLYSYGEGSDDPTPAIILLAGLGLLGYALISKATR